MLRPIEIIGVSIFYQKSILSDPHQVKCYRSHRIIENAKRKEEP